MSTEAEYRDPLLSSLLFLLKSCPFFAVFSTVLFKVSFEHFYHSLFLCIACLFYHSLIMIKISRRSTCFYFLAVVSVFTLYTLFDAHSFWNQPSLPSSSPPQTHRPAGFIRWKDLPTRYPVDSFIPLPTEPAAPIPRIQSVSHEETVPQRLERLERVEAVKKSFVHSWEGYKQHAWLQDEVAPMSGDFKNGFGGWGATLVDSLDTLWIMGLKKDFAIAVAALSRIDFTTSPLFKINIFETTIRYLGGFLSAYDVSEGKYPILLEKAIELGDMLYIAFDTPNRMPIMHWDWMNAAKGGPQEVPATVVLAEFGSLSLEFTRLTQLSGDPKYYDAIQRIMDVFEDQQNQTKLPGLWPITLNAKGKDFTKDRSFSLGALADSTYEYLPKQHLLLGGCSPQYQQMYETSLEVMKDKLFYRAMNPQNESILFAGTMKASARPGKVSSEAQHLTCFVGGMVGLAAKAFDTPDDMQIARQLTDGCVWAYESMPTGIMPESFLTAACTDDVDCQWSEEKWYQAIRSAHRDSDATRMSLEDHAQKVISEKGLAPGFTDITDARFLLRPEAIESVFILYRITGDRTLQDKAWKMFTAIESHARTDIAYASIGDVTAKSVKEAHLFDSMESFWTAETLKYFYLIFSEPDVISLDDFVFNTEAHPLRRP